MARFVCLLLVCLLYLCAYERICLFAVDESLEVQGIAKMALHYHTKKGDLYIFNSVDELSTGLAAYVADLSDKAIKQRGSVSVVLSGGTLIDELRKLTEAPYPESVDWKEWRVFWVDERVVPKTHPDSNYKLAMDGLLSKVPVNPDYIYAINDTLNAEGAAQDYEERIRELVKSKILDLSKDGKYPKFDLMLLGMGPDGHIASLFPHHPLIDEKKKWVTFIEDSPKPPPVRITYTLPVINSAANIAMVITGADLAESLAKVFGEELPHGSLPAQMVAPEDGKLVWFVDKDAASKLHHLESLAT